MKAMESNFAKYRLCWRWVNVICVHCGEEVETK